MKSQSSNTIEKVQIVSNIHKFYLDVTTNGIGTGTGVIGTNNRFTVFPNIELNPEESYTLKVIEFSYENIDSPANIKPLVLCDCTLPILVNNTTSSIIFKSSVRTGVAGNPVDLNESNNSVMTVDVNRGNLNSITFRIVRSDNGELFPFSGSEVVTLLIEFQNKI
jgi:hypothetical protein